jgi:glycerate 2-kinase
VRAALDAADAGRLVRLAVADPAIAAALRAATAVDVLAVGKAAAPMLNAFVAEALASLRYFSAIVPDPASGGSGEARRPEVPPGTRMQVAAHPVPDARSVSAAHVALSRAAFIGEKELLVVLLSGGASSLMALPAEGITLEDKQLTAQRLLAHGAEIHHLAAVRKHLSSVKGGRLAAATAGSVLTLAVSDVVGDDLSAIGGGPTVADETTFAGALGVLEEYGGAAAYPAAVVARLEHGAGGNIPETPKPGDPALARSTARVIGGRHAALAGARQVAEALGYTVHVIEEPTLGDARTAGEKLVHVASGISRKEATCILAAGETTVHVTGTGKGGRNQECALGMAIALHALGGHAVAASVGTDGVDGPTDAAGAIVDNTTLTRAHTAGLDVEAYLNDNDTYAFFTQLDDLMRTGATHTNVGDVQVILMN